MSRLPPQSLRSGWPQRLPPVMALLAVLCIAVGLPSAFLSMIEVGGLLAEHDGAVESIRDTALSAYDKKILAPPLNLLPRAEVARLSLLLGDAYFERRGAIIPLALLNLLSCWVLVTAAMGVLRRREFALPMWLWACTVNLPMLALSMVVSFVLSREYLAHLGGDAAAALAAVSKRPVPVELQELRAAARQYMTQRALLSALWAALLATTALYLQRRVALLPPPHGNGGKRPLTPL